VTYGRLDYPAEKLQPFGRDRIVMEANTEFERNMRIVACAKEPWTVAAIEAMQPGEVLWDVGANVGSYTLLAAARGIHVIAFEPVPENYATLCRNLAINQLRDQVVVLPFALGPGNGLIWMHFSDMRSGAASHAVNDSPRKVSLHKQLIPVITAELVTGTMGLASPHVIKLDVDGGEQNVLMGAEHLLPLGKLRAIICEMQRTPAGKALEGWMTERGWAIHEAYEPRGPIQYVLFTRAEPAVNGTPTELVNRAERRRLARVK
jgi:FkbM family methyltransferase